MVQSEAALRMCNLAVVYMAADFTEFSEPRAAPPFI